MSTNPKNSTGGNYFSGGLAELVSFPSLLTYSFLADWFTGKGSLGKAMKLLQIPYQEVNLHVLDLKDNELVVNLAREEVTLYQKTIFKYKRQTNIHNIPTLVVDFTKVINPICLINTIRIVLIQSKWIAKPQTTVETAQKLVDTIPNERDGTTIQEIDELLKNKVWSNVIAIGLMSEFYNQLIIKEAKGNLAEINKHISNTIVKDDWFFRSIADQAEVRSNQMSFTEYIEKYGLRADKDYELISPRWHEIQEIIKKRIGSNSGNRVNQNVALHVDKKLQTFIDASISLQLLRSESKRKALIHINQLREVILQATNGLDDISQITKEQLLKGQFLEKSQIENVREQKRAIKTLSISSGKGSSVSQGHASGLAKNIIDNDMYIPKGTIGIFPNASPEFAIQYPKCDGMIFLKGGQTSHGAIVAREFGIPALIDSKAQGITNNVKIELNGITGEWHIL